MDGLLWAWDPPIMAGQWTSNISTSFHLSNTGVMNVCHWVQIIVYGSRGLEPQVPMCSGFMSCSLQSQALNTWVLWWFCLGDIGGRNDVVGGSLSLELILRDCWLGCLCFLLIFWDVGLRSQLSALAVMSVACCHAAVLPCCRAAISIVIDLNSLETQVQKTLPCMWRLGYVSWYQRVDGRCKDPVVLTPTPPPLFECGIRFQNFGSEKELNAGSRV